MNLLITYSKPKDMDLLLDMAKYIHQAHVATCLENPSLPPFKMTVLSVVQDEAEKAEAVTSLEKTLEAVREIIPQTYLKIRAGNVENEITQEAVCDLEESYDLVLMGIHPPIRILRSLVFCTTEKVAKRIQIPLLVVRGETRPLKRILICDSGVESQPLAGQVVAALPDLFHSGIDVTLLHVMSQIGAWPGVRGWQLRADAEEMIRAHTPEGEILERDLQVLEGTNIRPHLKIRHGTVIDEIIAECWGGNYDLLIIGAHDGCDAADLLLEDMSREIILNAPCPVCVVHRKQLKTLWA